VIIMRMTEHQYADIAAACDGLLRGPRTSLARLAIPTLHFLNEHPGCVAQYAPLLAQRLKGDLSNIPRAVIRAARGLMRSLTAGAPRNPDEEGPIDVLIVSHLVTREQLGQENDFYFGALQSQLKERGATSLLVLINHLADPGRIPITRSYPFPRLILPRTVSPSTEVDIWKQCVGAWKALRLDAAGARDCGDRRLAMLASHRALSAVAVMNLRMHASLANLCRSVNPRIVMATYEGSEVERLIWHAARTAGRRPLCVGYQHAMVLERAHAIRRPVAAPGIDCDPEVILTLGEIPHAALAASPGLKAVRLIEYGSHRRAQLPVLPQVQDRPRRCLVLPDADHHECATLFEFALACARQRSDISFVLRPHPMVDTRMLLRRHTGLRKLPENATLSVGTPLEAEFSRTRYCLYRGSSAAMYAVRAGIKPFYLARPGELPFDCLSQLGDWREIVTSPQDLLDRIDLADTSTDSAAAGRAISICERYTSPLRPAAIDELLSMVAP
jgi:hypothetical protein